MRGLITGSAGHLGEALMRTLADARHEAVGIDIKRSSFTHHVGTITERAFVARSVAGGTRSCTHGDVCTIRMSPRIRTEVLAGGPYPT